MVLEYIMIKMLTITETIEVIQVYHTLGLCLKRDSSMCTTTLGPPSMSGASWFRSRQLQMSLKYWYAWTVVFFSTLASWAASVTAY